VLLPLLAACESGEPVSPASVAGSTTVATATTSSTTTVPPLTATTLTRPSPAGGTVTLRATDVRLFNSEESDNAFRALVESPASELSVVLSGLPSPNRVVLVCPATELERRVGVPGCITPGSGEAVKVPHRPDRRGVEVVQVGVAGSGAAGNSIVVPQVAITFTPASREVRLRLPPLRPGEGGPSFTLSPAGPGTYRATANWTAGAGAAELTFTAGTNVSRSEGSPGAQIMGSVSPAVEGTLAIRNTGSSTLSGVTATVLFP
jgi:hypothetical protein